MGRSRYKILDPQAVHFMTCTVVQWVPLFTRQATAEIILNALAWRQQERNLRLYGYVLLENHLHLIAQAPDTGLDKEMHSFKSYTAKQLVQYLESNGFAKMLNLLAFYKKEHKTRQYHQIWEEGFHPQLLEGEAMLLQKLEYVHNNPVKRGYVDDPVHWRYSSARNYAGMEGLIPVYTAWWQGSSHLVPGRLTGNASTGRQARVG